MGYLLEWFWLCLLLAGLLGLLFGYLLCRWFCNRQRDEYEGRIRVLEDRIAELEAANKKLEGAKGGGKVDTSKWELRIKELEDKNRELEGNLKSALADLEREQREAKSRFAAANAAAAATAAAGTAAFADMPEELAASSYPIEEIEGIGPGFGKALRALGIATTEDMLVKGRTHEMRSEIADKLDKPQVSTKVVTSWASMCDLCRVPGIRGQWAELLEWTSINSVDELSEQEKNSLMRRITEVNERENRVKELPSMDDLDFWIGRTRDMDQRIWFAADHVAWEAEAKKTGYEIEEVEGIGPGYGKRLRAQGIETTLDLLEKGKTPEQRRKIAETIDMPQIDEEVVTSWACMCDVMRTPGVMGQFAELLYFSGVKSVADIKSHSAGDLLDRITKTEEQQQRVPRLPALHEVAEWVEGVRDFGKTIDL